MHELKDHFQEDRKASRNLLVLAYYFPPENESGAQRPARFCKYLPRYGYQPVVIASGVRGNGDQMPRVFRTVADESDDLRLVRKVAVARALQRVLPYNDKIDWVPKAIATASQVLPHSNISAVISTSPPIATHMVALWLKRYYRLPWIADFRDPLLDNPFRNRFHGRLYDALMERWIVTKADTVIVNTDAALAAFRGRYPRCTHKFQLIWNGYDIEDDLKPAAIPPRTYKAIVHVGSIYGGRHPGRLVEAVARLQERGLLAPGEVRLRFVGSIDLHMPWVATSAFRTLVERGCIEYTDQAVSRLEAHKEMATADYLLLLDVNELGRGLQVPGKIFEYIRIGRPILAFTSRNSPVERILDLAGIPHQCIFADDLDGDVDRKVMDFLSLSSGPFVASSRFQADFDARTQTELLASLVSSLTAARR